MSIFLKCPTVSNSEYFYIRHSDGIECSLATPLQDKGKNSKITKKITKMDLDLDLSSIDPFKCEVEFVPGYKCKNLRITNDRLNPNNILSTIPYYEK